MWAGVPAANLQTLLEPLSPIDADAVYLAFHKPRIRPCIQPCIRPLSSESRLAREGFAIVTPNLHAADLSARERGMEKNRSVQKTEND